jgi:two-component sensor histidine kinase
VREAISWEPPISEERLLLGELTQRVKNEFAAAIGTVSLAASRSSNDEVKVALAAVEQRLHNYAQVHRCLEMPSHHTHMDASEHLRRLCQSISRSKLDSRGIELLLVERPLQMDSERCWRMGMIISELITNSACHAFGNNGGKIRVELLPCSAFAKCRVADNGRAPAKVRPGRGFTIVEALVASLDGTIERHFGPRGAVSVLTFPIFPAARMEAGRRSQPDRLSACADASDAERGAAGAPYTLAYHPRSKSVCKVNGATPVRKRGTLEGSACGGRISRTRGSRGEQGLRAPAVHAGGDLPPTCQTRTPGVGPVQACTPTR